MRRHDAPPTTTQIDRLLAFLPMFERPDFVPAWGRQVPEDLKGSLMEMEEEWAPELEAFHQAIYEEVFAFSFAWSEWQEQAAAYVNHPETLAQADLRDLCRLLTTYARSASVRTICRRWSAACPHHPAAAAAAAGDPAI